MRKYLVLFLSFVSIPAFGLELESVVVTSPETLTVRVRYKGCTKHRFRLNVAGACLQSLPTQRTMEIHDVSPDSCPEEIEETVDLNFHEFSNGCRPAWVKFFADNRGPEVYLPEYKPRDLYRTPNLERNAHVLSAKFVEVNPFSKRVELQIEYPSCGRQAHNFRLIPSNDKSCTKDPLESLLPDAVLQLVDETPEPKDCKKMAKETVELSFPCTTWRREQYLGSVKIVGKDDANAIALEVAAPPSK